MPGKLHIELKPFRSVQIVLSLAPFTRRRCENNRYEIAPIRNSPPKEIFPDRPPVGLRYNYTKTIRKLLKTIECGNIWKRYGYDMQLSSCKHHIRIDRSGSYQMDRIHLREKMAAVYPRWYNAALTHTRGCCVPPKKKFFFWRYTTPPYIQSEREIRVRQLWAQIVKMDELVFAKLAQGYTCEVYYGANQQDWPLF